MKPKYVPGDIITYNGITYRVRAIAKVGFEGRAAPTFYDLTDISSGAHECLPIAEIDEGIIVTYNEDIDMPAEEVSQGEAASFDMKSNDSYWDQMADKMRISPEARDRFKQDLRKRKTWLGKLLYGDDDV